MNKNQLAYMPILKLRPAERKALLELKSNIKKITPLLHVLPKAEDMLGIADPGLLDYHLSSIVNYSTLTKVYIDFSMICGDQVNELIKCIANKKVVLGGECDIVPVLYSKDIIGSELNSQSLTFLNSRGVLLRIGYEEFMKPQWWEKFSTSLQSKIIDKQKVAILIDVKDLKEDDYSPFVQTLNNSQITDEWGAFYVAIGSFPKSFTNIKDWHTTVNREDYIFWKDNFSTVSNVGYADYTVQFPHFKAPNKNARATVSISYTSEDVFHIYKGHSKGSKLVKENPLLQYFAHAVNLTQSNHFKGRTYSYGDNYIQEKADLYANNKLSNTGNFKDWLAVSINHHIVLTIDQLEHTYNGR